MLIAQWWLGGALGLLISVGASAQPAPTPKVREALAPTGTLRVAMPTAAVFASRDPSTAELKGPGIDLAHALASRLGISFVTRQYPNPGAIIAAAKTGEWDIALINMASQVAGEMDFSAPYMEVQQGFAVGPSSSIFTIFDLDRAGVRVGVLEKSGTDVYLTRTLKNATLVRVKSVTENQTLWESGEVDAIAGVLSGLFDRAAKRTGVRVLDYRFSEQVGVAVPKGRDAAAIAYIAAFVERAKAEGLIKSAIERSGIPGVIVAPQK